MDTTRKSSWLGAWRQANSVSQNATVTFNFCRLYVIVVVVLATSCAKVPEQAMTMDQQDNIDSPENKDSSPSPDAAASDEATSDETALDAYTKAREEMVTRQLAVRDIVDQRVLDTMRRVPRHEFVAPNVKDYAYHDSPLGIGEGQTISQPYIVALMTQLVEPEPEHKALDVGTGSGYQAAVLAELVKEVYSIEIVESLADEARVRLETLGYKNIVVRHGDGYRGWKTQAPFDVIIVAAAPDHIPKALIEQLAPGGKLVIPVGDRYQTLIVVEKQQDGTVKKRDVAPVAFVPMTGEAEK